MDAALTAILGAAPQLGGAGVLLALLGLLLRSAAQDRADYRSQLTATQERHTAELTRVSAAHDAELAELRAEIKGLRGQVAELNEKLDDERSRRRAAEDRIPGQEPAMGQLDQPPIGGSPWQR